MQFAGLNYFAIVVAAVVSFMFGWLWYGVLLSRQWIAAVGKSEEEIKAEGGPSPTPVRHRFHRAAHHGLDARRRHRPPRPG